MRRSIVNIATLLVSAAVLGAAPGQASAQTDAPGTMQVSVSPSPFSPNGDRRLDETTITVTSDQPANVRIEILDSEDVPVRAWTASVGPAAPAAIGWDGTAEGENAEVLPDGPYRVRARGESPIDLVDEAEAAVALDTQAPKLEWAGGSPVVTTDPDAAFRFMTSDPSAPLHARLEIESREGEIGGVEADVSSGIARMLWRARMPRGKRLYPGTYFARVTVRDAAGNDSRSTLSPWRVLRQMHAHVWREVPGAGRRVAITIDDCHHAGAWSSMLATLRRAGAGATFFCPGQQVLANPGLARRTIRDGHDIGSHGWDHASPAGLSEGQISWRLRADADALWHVARRTTAPYYRPPYGALTHAAVAAAGRTAHARVILWDVDPQDWRSPGVSTIAARVLQGAGPGSIVLLHTLDQSAAALPAILSGLRRRGLDPVGLPELFDAAAGGAGKGPADRSGASER